MKASYRTCDVARAWDCSTHTVRRLVDKGTLESFRLHGRERRVLHDSLARYCAEMGLHMPAPVPPQSKPLKPLKPLTTGQVADYCGVSPRMVQKWHDSGTLKGYRIPGAQDRRFERFEVADFMRRNGMRVPRELMCGVRVTYALSLPAPVPDWEHCDAFQLGELCGTKPILAAVIGDEMGTDAAVKAAEHVRKNNPDAAVVFVVDPSNAAATLPGEVRVRGEVELGELLGAL